MALIIFRSKTKLMKLLVLKTLLALEFIVNCQHQLLAELSPETIAIYKNFVLDPDLNGKRLNGRQNMGIREILNESIQEHEYSVLEAALTNPNVDVRCSVITRYLTTVPDRQRKEIILKFLTKQGIWPDDSGIEKFELTSGPMPYLYLIQQERFCDVISETFGKQLKYSGLWTGAERAALAESLHPQFSSSSPVKNIVAERDPSSQTVTSSKGESSHANRSGPQAAVADQNSKIRTMNGWVYIAVSATALAGAAIWVIARRRFKKMGQGED